MPSQQKPLLTVVVATYNRADVIPRTLRRLAEQTLDPSQYEVIVVDDGSPDDTENVVKGLKQNVPYKLTYLRHQNRGPGYTENRGIRTARAPIVCLIADDILLTPKALEAHLEEHRRDEGVNVAVLGKVELFPDLHGRSVFLRHWDYANLGQIEGLRELPYYFFWAWNLSFKKTFLMEHGMFRESTGSAGPASHEDPELGYVLSKEGLRIFYSEEALGYHDHVETLDGAVRRAYERGINWVGFREKVEDPAITVRYHVSHPSYLKDYVAAFRNKEGLIGVERSPFRLAVRVLGRKLLFNRHTVPSYWLPLLLRAEKNSLLARFMNRLLYRCVISYHFHKGIADGHRAHVHSQPASS